MNWKLSGFGAEPKKVAILVALGAIAGYFYISNRTPGGDSAPATPAPAGTTQPAAAPRVGARPTARTLVRAPQKGLNPNSREFKPIFKRTDIDPSSIDPTLRLDLLAKLQDVQVEAGTRSLFEIGKEPPPEPGKPGSEPAKVVPTFVSYGPKAPPDPPPPPPDPKAPPIPLKFYGFVNPSKAASDKRAFFLDGEDIVIAAEGEMVKKRYKIVRIGVNSAVVEDTQFKSNNQQTLPLEAEMAG